MSSPPTPERRPSRRDILWSGGALGAAAAAAYGVRRVTDASSPAVPSRADLDEMVSETLAGVLTDRLYRAFLDLARLAEQVRTDHGDLAAETVFDGIDVRAREVGRHWAQQMVADNWPGIDEERLANRSIADGLFIAANKPFAEFGPSLEAFATAEFQLRLGLRALNSGLGARDLLEAYATPIREIGSDGVFALTMAKGLRALNVLRDERTKQLGTEAVPEVSLADLGPAMLAPIPHATAALERRYGRSRTPNFGR